jgi:N-acetylmuramoyl-L-alanine amidase
LSSKKLWQLLITFELKSSSLANKVIVIDPGHGGTDPGAISPNGLRETGSSI